MAYFGSYETKHTVIFSLILTGIEYDYVSFKEEANSSQNDKKMAFTDRYTIALIILNRSYF